MKKVFQSLVLFLTIGTVLSSCVEHEVIPAPVQIVNLPVSFSADLNGVHYELIKDVNGYDCRASQTKEILTSPDPSNITYSSSIESNENPDWVKISLGQLQYIPNNEGMKPSIDEFNAYFENMPAPEFKDEANGGVQISFKDSQGIVWTTLENATTPQSIEFTEVKAASDKTGDYIKFVAEFNATLYKHPDSLDNVLLLQNALFEGYFKR